MCKEVSFKTKLVLVCTLACLTSSQTLLIAFSKTKDKDGKSVIPYHSITTTLFAEILKLVVCLVCFSVKGSKEEKSQRIPFKKHILFLIPGALYAIDNNLPFLILVCIDAPTMSVVWNLKIFFTALFFSRILKKTFMTHQWIAVALLLIGVLTSQSDHVDFTQHDVTGKYLIGILLCLLGAAITSLAGVYTEKLLKKDRDYNFFLQNSMLYVYGILCNSIGLIGQYVFHAFDSEERDFFHGYSWWTIAVIITQASSGLCVAAIFKYINNIAGLFAHVGAMLVVLIISSIFGSFSPTLTFLCGFSTCTLAIFLYHHEIKATDYALLKTENNTELMDNEDDGTAYNGDNKSILTGITTTTAPTSTLTAQNTRIFKL